MTRHHRLFLLTTLALGIALRLVGLDRGASDLLTGEQLRAGRTASFHAFHPDETTLIQAALALTDPFDPPLTTYGILPLYLLRLPLALIGGDAADDFTLHLTARYLSALISIAALLLVWPIARRFLDSTGAGLALLFTAVVPLAVRQAHFYTVDGPFVLFCLAAFYALLRALDAGELRWYLIAGLLIGATGAVRFNGLLLGPVLLLGHLFGGREDPTPGRRLDHLFDRELWAAGAVALLTLLLLQPFLLTAPERLADTYSHRDFGFSLAVARGEILQPWSLVDVHTLPYLHHWIHLFPQTVGWPLTVAFLLGVGYALWKRGPCSGLLLLWSGLYFAQVGGLHTKHVRYLLPLLPFLAILAAGLLVDLARRYRFGWAPAGLLVLLSTLHGLAFARIYTAPDSRIQAARWIAANIPPGSRIGVEHGGFSMRGLIDRQRHELGEMGVMHLFYTGPYMLARHRVRYLREQLAPLDYIAIVEVNRYRQFTVVSDLFPVAADFYWQLVEGDLGFAPVARFAQYPGLFGLEFPDDDAEPSFIGYDHPAVLILQRRSPGAVAAAFDAWESSVETDPYCADPLLRRAAVHIQRQEWDAALPPLTGALERTPLAKLAHLLAAEIYHRRGDLRAAAEARRRFRPDDNHPLTLHLRNPSTLHRIPGATAATLVDLGLPDLALRTLESGAHQSVNYSYGAAHDMAETYVRLCQQFLQLGQVESVRRTAELAAQIYPLPTAYNALARLASFSGDPRQAAALWERSIRCEPAQPEIHTELVKVAAQALRDPTRARRYLEGTALRYPELAARLAGQYPTADADRP